MNLANLHCPFYTAAGKYVPIHGETKRCTGFMGEHIASASITVVPNWCRHDPTDNAALRSLFDLYGLDIKDATEVLSLYDVLRMSLAACSSRTILLE